ncbi:MAG: molybdopterin-synthase adenylyltransferase MoeB [Planctomycetota bacterium]
MDPPVVNPDSQSLSDSELKRYSRQLMLSEIGEAGQLKLRQSSVLVVGAGGLGSPAAIYLTASGVGRLGIVDGDVVEASNLQRQILHRNRDVGRPKTFSACRTLESINPDIDVEEFPGHVDAENVLRIVAGYDIVVDGTDNFSSRYLIADACRLANRPLVSGAILQFDGQVTLLNVGDGPCYRCLYPSPPTNGAESSCSDAGVLGVLPGVIGTIQATEAIKWILEIGQSLSGRLLTYDALAMQFRSLVVRRKSECPLCGPLPKCTSNANTA